MFKQMFTILFNVILLAVFIDSASLYKKREQFSRARRDSFVLNHPLQQFAKSGANDPQQFARSDTNDPEQFASGANAPQKFQQEMLNAHNVHRECHGAPPLILDENLNADAQSYAEYLVSIRSLVHSNTNNGENLYMEGGSSSINGRVPTDAWFNEINKYNFDRGSFSGATGHFTQLVWKGSRRLGVGIAYTGDGGSAYVVARYSPAGNVIGRFQENVFPSQC